MGAVLNKAFPCLTSIIGRFLDKKGTSSTEGKGINTGARDGLIDGDKLLLSE